MRQNDDDDQAAFEPPPDPSLRAWRHPSEIASAEAAAARMLRQEQVEEGRMIRLASTPSSNPPRALTGVVIVAAALVLATAAATTLAVTTLGVGLSTTNDLTYGGSQVGPADLPGALLSSEVLPSSAPLVTAAFGSTILAAGPAPYDGTSSGPWADVLPPADSDPDEGMAQGVYDLDGGAPHRLAAFAVIDGLVVTTASALGGATELAVSYHDISAPATIAGTDPVTDIALLEVDEETCQALQEALAHDIAATAIRADVNDSNRWATTADGQRVYGALVTDTPPPSGANGAALVDGQGAIVGLVIGTAGDRMAALPADVVAATGRALRTWQRASLAWIGLDRDVTSLQPVAVAAVTPGGPAHTADLHPGDVITTVNGTIVEEWTQFVYLIRQIGPGGRIMVTLERDGALTETTLIVGSSTRPETPADAPFES